MATLMIVPGTPREGTGGGIRTVNVARAIARHTDLDIAYVAFDGTEPSSTLRLEPRVTLRPIEASRGAGRASAYARARLAGAPRAFARGISPELIDAAADTAGYDRVVVENTTGAAMLLLKGRQSLIYDGANVESEFRTGFSRARHEYGSKRSLERFERKVFLRAAESWLPTRRDVATAADLAPGAALRYVPNVVDVAGIEVVAPSTEPHVLFVADQRYEPNYRAADHLVETVMPALWASMPSAVLTVVGRNADRHRGRDPRLEVRGFVDELDAVYRDAACVVVPLLDGGGSPLKMLEAMAHGLPVVATPQAVRGFDTIVAGVHFVQGDGAEQLAQVLRATLAGEFAHVGPTGRALVEQEYSIETLAELVR